MENETQITGTEEDEEVPVWEEYGFASEEEMKKARIEAAKQGGISEEELEAYDKMVEELRENVEVYPDDDE
ncbi:hypothetical protein [Butyrivibrio sp. INlla16]|uniref:hypothetical protein n=1 Tax=Butyrivibrio sp. INlla16 TaxID=1520807 RepID=UPI000B83029F|nr:hypothetical protein [Butyrivibrio sp. INlla16]